jgi:hypothetical protein
MRSSKRGAVLNEQPSERVPTNGMSVATEPKFVKQVELRIQKARD